jgi:hypothetical protein
MACSRVACTSRPAAAVIFENLAPVPNGKNGYFEKVDVATWAVMIFGVQERRS